MTTTVAAHSKKTTPTATATATSARIPIPDIKHPHHVPYNELESQKESVYKAEHTHSLMALCCVIFTFGYLVISVFPYSGFMAIELVDGVDEENAGYYAGLISSSFMAGRALTSYHWGKAADVYGRVTVLLSSLVLSLIFSVLFGLSGSFTVALIWRFLLGLGNGLMGTVKTVVSEIADGDKNLETKGMGIIVSMWGWSLLASPAISGALVQPITQYPHVWQGYEDTSLYKFFDAYPFFLANVLGAVLCLLSIYLVDSFVKETLPSARLRHPKHIPNDVFRSLRSMLSTINEEESDGLLATTASERSKNRSSQYGSMNYSSRSSAASSMDSDNIRPELLAFAEDDIEDSIRRSTFAQNEESTLLCTGNMRGTLAHSIARRSSVQLEERRMSRLSSIRPPSSAAASSIREEPVKDSIEEEEEEQEATLATLWAQKNTRNHLIVYWIGNFVMVSMDEGLPLFFLSREGGLSLSAKSIGTILSISGGLFVLLQYVTYARLVELLGLYGSMKFGAVSMAPFMALVPIALILNEKGRVAVAGSVFGEDDDLVEQYGDLTWPALIFLSVLMAIYRVLFMAFLSSLMVGMNRTVIPAHRGTMNGFCTLGGSVTKAIGPSFAGLLVAVSLSSGLFAPSVGAVFLFLVLSIIGGLVATAALLLLKEEDEPV